MRIGILAVQGSIIEHKKMLEKIGAETLLVKKEEDLKRINGIVLPGGESTTFITVLTNLGIFEKIKEKIFDGLPVLATCAGLIFIAKRVENYPEQKTLGALDVTISRNAYGRQKESFSTYLDIPVLGDAPFEAIFIRAPQISDVGKNVKIHASFNGKPVFVEENNIIALTFHPELTEDTRIHEYFLTRCKE